MGVEMSPKRPAFVYVAALTKPGLGRIAKRVNEGVEQGRYTYLRGGTEIDETVGTHEIRHLRTGEFECELILRIGRSYRVLEISGEPQNIEREVRGLGLKFNCRYLRTA